MVLIYESTETNFNHLGLGSLCPLSCSALEEINGKYDLEMTHPIDDGGKWEKLEEERIIKAPTHRGDQLFRIYSLGKDPKTGMINVRARHVFYDLLHNLLEDVRPTVKNGQEAGDIMLAGCQYATPFTFSSDITAVSTAYYIRMNPVRAFIGNDDQSFINRWGGEIVRDNHHIAVNTRTGADNGARIAYAKNITGLNMLVDKTGVYTRLMPTALDENNVVFYTDAKYYDSPLIGSYPHPKIGILNTGIRVGQEVDGSIPYPTVASAKTAMAAMAQAAFDKGVDKPKLTLNVGFVNWKNTEEYKAFAPLLSVGLGDDVVIDYKPLNIDVKLRVVAIEWDCLQNRAKNLTLGDKEPNFAKTVADIGIDLSALRNDAAGALQEGEIYNGVYINHKDGFMTIATVSGKTITVKLNSVDGLAIFDGSTYKGGAAVVGGEVVNVSNIITNNINGDCYATIGDYTVGSTVYKGIFVFNKAVSTTVPVGRFVFLGSSMYIFDGNNINRIILGTSSALGTNFRDRLNRGRIYFDDDSLSIYAPSGNTAIATNNTSGVVWSPSTNNAIGADAGGPFYIKNGSKVYF